MKHKDEKLMLLSAISKLQNETNKENISIDTVQRYLNLLECLIALNWQEVERRKSNDS